MAERIHVHCSFDTRLSPDGVIAALTDLADRRTELWPDIDPSKYRIPELGTDRARVTEGDVEPDSWALERYDWDREATSPAWEPVMAKMGLRLSAAPSGDRSARLRDHRRLRTRVAPGA